MDVDNAGAVIDRCHAALGEFFRGDPGPVLELFSHEPDVTLGNPFGPFVRGWERVRETASRAATHYRDGIVVGFDRVAAYVSADLACFVEVERYRAIVGQTETMASIALRVSTLLRRETGGWRIVSRHADPITDSRAPESVIEARISSPD